MPLGKWMGFLEVLSDAFCLGFETTGHDRQQRKKDRSCLVVLSVHCFLSQQTGEYATDDEDTGTVAEGDKNIEVFDLPETEDILSPSELDATKLYQKFREVKSSQLSRMLTLRQRQCS